MLLLIICIICRFRFSRQLNVQDLSLEALEMLIAEDHTASNYAIKGEKKLR